MQSSPGYLHVGHVPSKWTWQMPQTSSSGISHRHVATAFHFLILTFILIASPSILYTSESVIQFVGWRRKVEAGDVYFTSSRSAVAPIKSDFHVPSCSYQQLAACTTHTTPTSRPSQPLFPNKLLASSLPLSHLQLRVSPTTHSHSSIEAPQLMRPR